MPYGVSSAFQWFASAFYVIVSLAIVYLYFFRLVPLVISKVGAWTLAAVIQVTIVLAAVAILLGGAAVFTADWIFSQVLTTLPNTRMAYEINRITGSVMQLPAGAPSSGSYASPYDSQYTMPESGEALPTPSGAVVLGSGSLGSAAASSLRLKPNALGIWASNIEMMYNPTGATSDNSEVMSKRNIPVGVTCYVYSIEGGLLPKRYEEWRLDCSDDGFSTQRQIPVNGTAARGLTGGSYHSAENPLPVSGTGQWPEDAYEPAADPSPTPGGAPGEPTPTPDAPIEPAMADAGSNGPGGTHTVEAGESLASIASRYGTTVDSIIQQNVQKYPQLQNNPNVIRTGWALDIP